MGRRAKNKQGPPQSLDAVTASTNAKRKADGYVPRSGGKKVRLGATGKKIKGKHVSVSRGGDRVEGGAGDSSDDDEEEEREIKPRPAPSKKGKEKAKAAVKAKEQ